MRRLIRRMRANAARRRAERLARRRSRMSGGQEAAPETAAAYTASPEWIDYINNFDARVTEYLSRISPDQYNDDFFDADIEAHFKSNESYREAQKAHHIEAIEGHKRSRQAALKVCGHKIEAINDMLRKSDEKINSIRAELDAENGALMPAAAAEAADETADTAAENNGTISAANTVPDAVVSTPAGDFAEEIAAIRSGLIRLREEESDHE